MPKRAAGAIIMNLFSLEIRRIVTAGQGRNMVEICFFSVRARKHYRDIFIRLSCCFLTFHVF